MQIIKQKTVLTVSSGNWSSKTVNIALIYPLVRGTNNIRMSHGCEGYDSVK